MSTTNFEEYTVLRVWPQFSPWTLRTKIRAFWWIFAATVCLLPAALWNHYHSTLHGTPNRINWLVVGCNDKEWFRL